MDDSHFDVIILGTGLTESITAAALSKAGYKVAHIDTNAYYGSDDASLSLEELIEWANKRSFESSSSASSSKLRYTSISHSNTRLPFARQYSISLTPALIYSIGPLISSLVSSGVAKYGGYRLLQRISVFRAPGHLASVPGSKEDVFKNKDISLIDKRRLMRFLMFAVGDFEDKPELSGKEDHPFHEFLQSTFSLNEEATMVITYALAYCVSPSDPTKPALERVRRFLRSSGRYGSGSFLVGHYGGAGEIAQGFCRTAAVSGAVYILGRTIASISPNDTGPSEPSSPSPAYTVTLDDFPDPLTCNLLISTPRLAPEALISRAAFIPPTSVPQLVVSVARCVAIIDRALVFPTASQPTHSEGEEPESGSPDAESVDTAMLIFPPASVVDGSETVPATAILMGEGTMSTPAGKWILYISLPVLDNDRTAEFVLQPYLSAALSFATEADSNPLEPSYTLFYYEHHQSPPQSTATFVSASAGSERSTLLVTPPTVPQVSEFFDSAAKNAEATFWRAIDVLKNLQPRNANEDSPEVASFWPAVEQDVDDDDEW